MASLKRIKLMTYTKSLKIFGSKKKYFLDDKLKKKYYK